MTDLDPIIDARKGCRGDFFDAASGELVLIRWVVWGNLSTGEYVAFVIDPAKAERLKILPEHCTKRGRTKLVWVERPTPKDALSTPLAAGATRREHSRVLMIPGNACEHYACTRTPEWRVADVCDGPPEAGTDGKQFATTAVVAVHRYCPWHYRLPRTVAAEDHRETVRQIEPHLAQPGA